MPASAAPAGEALLEARAIELWRGEHHLLRRVSFRLNAGELLQVTGENGAGKTSLLRVVCGLLPAETGDILWRGVSILEGRDAYHRDVVYLAHLNALKLDLTADENLKAGAGLRRDTTRSEREAVLTALGVARCVDLPARVLSAGQRRRVAFARVLLSKAPLWILDEPTTNLDVHGVELIERLIRDHLEEGGSVLTAAHHGLLAGHPRARQLVLAG
jgi:heme exporter protein A